MTDGGKTGKQQYTREVSFHIDRAMVKSGRDSGNLFPKEMEGMPDEGFRIPLGFRRERECRG